MSRLEHYIKQSNYPYINKIRDMFLKKSDSLILLNYLKKGLIKGYVNTNDYIQHPYDKNCWIPLIYMFSLTNQYHEIVKLLLKRKAIPSLEPDVDIDCLKPILFNCHSLYLSHFINKGKCNLNYPNSVLLYNLKNVLRCAEWKRLQILDNLKFINGSKLIIDNDEDLVYFCILTLKNYLFYCYNERKNLEDKTTETNNTINKFVKTIDILHKWGHTFSSESFALCKEFYMYEFLSLNIFKDNHDDEKVVFHEDLLPLKVACFRPLLNDFRYAETCRILKMDIDERLNIRSSSIK
uniref:Ankyrin repeat protein n=1 Tax=viral metagenome TaxID=1070528 RepID=A0A6C0J739_9ZZZZ